MNFVLLPQLEKLHLNFRWIYWKILALRSNCSRRHVGGAWIRNCDRSTTPCWEWEGNGIVPARVIYSGSAVQVVWSSNWLFFQARTRLILPWLILQWISTVSVLVGTIVAAVTGPIPVGLYMAVHTVVGGFFLYVVHQRLKDIIAKERQATVSGQVQM